MLDEHPREKPVDVFSSSRSHSKFCFGSDYPFITPQRWMKDFEALKIEFKPEVREKLFWRNGQKLLAHTAVGQMRFSLQ